MANFSKRYKMQARKSVQCIAIRNIQGILGTNKSLFLKFRNSEQMTFFVSKIALVLDFEILKTQHVHIYETLKVY